MGQGLRIASRWRAVSPNGSQRGMSFFRNWGDGHQSCGARTKRLHYRVRLSLGCSRNNEKSNWNWRENWKKKISKWALKGNTGEMFLPDFFFLTPQSSLSIIASTSKGNRRYHVSARGKSTSPPACLLMRFLIKKRKSARGNERSRLTAESFLLPACLLSLAAVH